MSLASIAMSFSVNSAELEWPGLLVHNIMMSVITSISLFGQFSRISNNMYAMCHLYIFFYVFVMVLNGMASGCSEALIHHDAVLSVEHIYLNAVML